MKINKKIIVIYLSTKYSKIDDLKNFIKFYKKYKSGADHKLLICFKQLSNFELKKRLKFIGNLRYFVDPIKTNDQEWGSLKRICEIFTNNYKRPL